jgi:small subunit ribosomal protein S5
MVLHSLSLLSRSWESGRFLDVDQMGDLAHLAHDLGGPVYFHGAAELVEAEADKRRALGLVAADRRSGLGNLDLGHLALLRDRGRIGLGGLRTATAEQVGDLLAATLRNALWRGLLAKRFGFAALVIVGDGKGRAGFGHGKAREVPEAISKATAAAKKAMIRVPLKEGRTLHHDGKGHFGAGLVTLRSAPQGTGIIAGGPMRAIFESLGVADVVTKSVGTSNPYNMIRATFEALKEQTSPRSVAQRRGKKVADLLGRGGANAAEAEAQAEAVE